MQKHVIIVAGGKGSRLGSILPKQFIEVYNKPVLMHTFEPFLRYSSDIQFILVLPEKHISFWERLCLEHAFSIRHKVVAGGPTRFHSVKNALKTIPAEGLVAVHDGVRPLLTPGLVSRVFHFAEKFGSAIPVVPVRESVRLIDQAMSSPLPRNRVRLVQTPQCFRAEILIRSYKKSFREEFTDDATVVEPEGERLFLVDGECLNIKISTDTDLVIAEALLKKKGFNKD